MKVNLPRYEKCEGLCLSLRTSDYLRTVGVTSVLAHCTVIHSVYYYNNLKNKIFLSQIYMNIFFRPDYAPESSSEESEEEFIVKKTKQKFEVKDEEYQEEEIKDRRLRRLQVIPKFEKVTGIFQ